MLLTSYTFEPTPALLQLAQRHGIQATDETTAPALSEMLQAGWIRQTAHQYQIPGGPPSDEDRALLNELGMINEVVPLTQAYQGALILGGTVVAVRKRLAFLAKAWQDAADLELLKVCLLGGARPLDPIKESPTVLCTPAELPFKHNWKPPATLPTTEAGMMRLVFEQSLLPPEWEPVFIDTPLQPAGEVRRNPNTSDTVRDLLKTNPLPGMYLVVSSQPFVTRQTINVRQTLPIGFTAIGCGYAAPPTTPLKTFLDEVARLLYEEVAQIKP